MKIIFKSNIMYNLFLGAVKYSQQLLYAESNFRLILAILLALLGILCKLFNIENRVQIKSTQVVYVLVMVALSYDCCGSRLLRNGISVYEL